MPRNFPTENRLQQRLTDGQPFSWDESTDIGWQIASALQQAHNVGMTHGQLSADSVIVSGGLRAKVAGFGLYRWIAAATADAESTPTFSSLAKQDLMDFGRLLTAMLNHATANTKFTADNDQPSDLRDLIATLRDPPNDFTARDVQGRLGNMLLQVAGDSIAMIDHRHGQGIGRRSIIDELFGRRRCSHSYIAAGPGCRSRRADALVDDCDCHDCCSDGCAVASIEAGQRTGSHDWK